MNLILNYLSQPSTWRGIIGIATFCGVALNPEQANAIIAGALGIMGVINVFRNEKKVG